VDPGDAPRTLPRWGYLTDWGQVQIARHHRSVSDAAPADRILPGGRPGSALAQSTAVGTITRTLRDAGLHTLDGVRPSSVAAWAGWIVFEQTRRIEIVAKCLGLRSLDRTARFIGWDWSNDG
jgi:integrase/recombinase XerC